MNIQEPSFLHPPKGVRLKTLIGAEEEGSRLRVLIVEDDDTQREVLRDLIQRAMIPWRVALPPRCSP